jgi:hypothetical protein
MKTNTKNHPCLKKQFYATPTKWGTFKNQMNYYTIEKGKLTNFEVLKTKTPWLGSNWEQDAKYTLANYFFDEFPKGFNWAELKVSIL